ncbi:MAG: hypothetical protein E4H01_07340 [Lysobacterales bacterium]|nr:MAG: hypothetical protein E4H01_07340 [Xanthomonadales bacterium]
MAETDFGLRPDGTRKGSGYLGSLKLPNGNVATEFSIGVNLDGTERDIPTIVPTLTKEEITRLVSDIIPNNKPIPKTIIDKAVAHARMRMAKGLDPFAGPNDKVATPSDKGKGFMGSRLGK